MGADQIVVADENEAVRAALVKFLRSADTDSHIEGVCSLAEAAERAASGQADMVFIELSSYGAHELASIPEYRRRYQGTSWVVVSLFRDLSSTISRQTRDAKPTAEMERSETTAPR